MQVWNIVDRFGRPGVVRLTEEGKLEKKLCGQRIWHSLAIIDLSIFTTKEMQDILRKNQGIRKLTRQRG